MEEDFAIHWFRQDLRISDNPSLNYLSTKYKKIVCVYIFDEENCDRKLGSASKIWLYHSLKDLNNGLKNRILFYKGNPQKVFDEILSRYNVHEICWNRCYEPWIIKRDKNLKSYLQKKVSINSFNSSLLWEPWEIVKNDGTPYKIFTPFYKRGCLNHSKPRRPEIKKIDFFNHNIQSLSLEELNIRCKNTWEKKIINNWKIGESYALELMNIFFSSGVYNYSEGRNFPSKQNVSRLSPYIHWGQISPNILWYESENAKNKFKENFQIFQSELGWREFSYNLMYHFPKIQSDNLQKKFDNFPWEQNYEFLKLWKKGLTGYPIVDAGMRELWQTGYMHNRVRMITGSFLVKNLLQHWHHGEKWFWDCLFDADYASNSASWQWVAGTGSDSTPYFRIFNPISQAKKFDPHADYIKKFVPELAKLPLKYIFEPWECPTNIMEDLGFKFGKDYPLPIVDIKESREKALNAFSSLKKMSQ